MTAGTDTDYTAQGAATNADTPSPLMDREGIDHLIQYFSERTNTPLRAPAIPGVTEATELPVVKYDRKSHAALESSPSFSVDRIAGMDDRGQPIYEGPQAGRSRYGPPEEESAGSFGREPPFRGWSAGRR